ncbi:MAG: YcxB family protein [Roseburia sp.]
MPIEFDVTLTAKDIYRFNMYQLYSGFQGWFSVIASVFLFVMTGVTWGKVESRYTLLYVVCGGILLLYPPFSMLLRSKQRLASTEMLRAVLHYEVGENGIAVSQGEAHAELPWEQIYKMVVTKSNVLVYSNRIHAYVIPRDQLGECCGALVKLAQTKLPKYRIKAK